jgi:transposase
MQTKREQFQQEMTLLPPLETLIPEDHPLRGLNRVLDLSFVHGAVRDKYNQENGRPSIDPEVIVRLFLIQAMYGMSRVRELMREVQVNLAYRWFIGYRLDERLPDHSTLSKVLDRFGDAVFNELFERSISQCKKSGLIEGKVLHVDATTIRADLDRNRVEKADSPDPDARFGRFPGDKLEPGYKQHTIADGRSRVILGLSVTSADRPEHDEAIPILDDALRRLEEDVPEAVCGDAAYASGENYMKMKKRGQRLISPPPKAKTYTGDEYFSTEDFEYDEENDLFVCPWGTPLKYVYTEKKRGRRIYQALRTDCRKCPLKSGCTKAEKRQLKVSAYHSGLVQLRAASKTKDFKELYSTRAPVIEGVFAEAKQWHGLGRAWRRGLSKMLVQSLLIATVINLKRLMARLVGFRRPIRAFLRAIWALVQLSLIDISAKPASSVQLRVR